MWFHPAALECFPPLITHVYEGSHPQHFLLCKQQVTRSITTIYTKIICTYLPVHIHFCSTLHIPVVEGEVQSGNWGNEKITNKINPDPHWRELKKKSHSKAFNSKELLSRSLTWTSWTVGTRCCHRSAWLSPNAQHGSKKASECPAISF